jgi:lauroyl/myristoyl acyltransferase
VKRPSAATIIRTAPQEYEGWISASDLFTAGKLFCCALAALTPQRHWAAASRLIAGVHLRLRSAKRERIAHVCERYLDTDPAQLELQVIAAEYEENIEAIRENLPGGWERPIELRGAASIEQARRLGRGAVLWISRFAHSDLVAKRALWRAGYAPSHLSHVRHPFSATRVGARFLNPIRLRAENRYLERRVLVSYGQARPALEVLKQVLRGNGVVTITAIGSGRKVITLPLLGGTLRLATGAPRLALDTTAALIPVFTVPNETGGYAVHCGPDLNVDKVEQSPEEAMRRMAEQYVALLETFVRAHPAKWKGWFTLSWAPQAARSPNNAPHAD